MTFSRRDVWSLPAADTTLSEYAGAVAVMQKRPASDPTSWAFQAAMHGSHTKSAAWPFNQCKHFSWWFLPWHRMYLYYFERIVRAAVVAGHGSPDWALPYWNYGGGGADATLPQAFRDPQTGGTANPLYVRARAAAMNNGKGSIPPRIGVPTQALRCDLFVGSVGDVPAEFGGSPADPALQFANVMGVLENTPHNQVHNLVGGKVEKGLMFDPDTAAQDPIFWLHHANIDRVWEQWASTHANPTDPSWLSQSFRFYDADGQEKALTCADVLDISTQLDYTYVAPPPAKAPTPPSRPALAMVSPGGRPRRAELVGASDAPVTLRGVPVTVELEIDQRAAQQTLEAAGAARPDRIYLAVQEIQGDSDPGTVYGIYLNLPAQSAPDVAAAHYAGSLSFFGIAKSSAPRGDASPHSMSVSHDITSLTDELRHQGEWDEQHVSVTFQPTDLVPPDKPELAHALPEVISDNDPPVTIGRVGIFYR